LARPGGQSSLTFGLLPSPSPTKKPEEPPAPKEEIQEEKATVQKEVETVEEPKKEEEAAVSVSKEGEEQVVSPSKVANSKPQSANAFISGNNMNGGCVMTDRPSSRVLAPPGGHTSIKLG